MACVVFQVMSRRWRDSGDGGWLARRPSAGVLVDFETESILNIIQSHPLSRVVIWFIGYDTPEGVLTHYPLPRGRDLGSSSDSAINHDLRQIIFLQCASVSSFAK